MNQNKKTSRYGSICGGVISSSMNRRLSKKDPYTTLMCFVLPDDKFKEWVKFKRQGKNEEAEKIFKKYAISQI